MTQPTNCLHCMLWLKWLHKTWVTSQTADSGATGPLIYKPQWPFISVTSVAMLEKRSVQMRRSSIELFQLKHNTDRPLRYTKRSINLFTNILTLLFDAILTYSDNNSLQNGPRLLPSDPFPINMESSRSKRDGFHNQIFKTEAECFLIISDVW